MCQSSKSRCFDPCFEFWTTHSFHNNLLILEFSGAIVQAHHADGNPLTLPLYEQVYILGSWLERILYSMSSIEDC